MILVRILKLLFCFKRPELINFSYINVLINDKPTLFVVWEIKNVWSVKIIPLKRRYFTTKNTLILSIPKDQNEVVFKASNLWRETNIKLTMRAVELDEVTIAQLIDGFRPLSKLEVSAPIVWNIRNKIAMKSISIKQKNSFIKEIDPFNINIHPFNYP